MSTLTIDLISSLDGFAAAEGWPGLWGFDGPEMFQHFDEDGAKDHVLVMGATTYRLMSEIVSGADDPMSTRMNEVDKVVFSSTLDEPLTWSNSRLVRTDAVSEIKAMKEGGGPPIRTLGSLSLSRSLLDAGVVDRYRVVIFPVVTGKNGRDPIYAGMPDVKLELVESRTLDGQLQLLEYVPTVLTDGSELTLA